MTEYSTSNLSVSAFLLVREFALDRLEERGETIFFVFRDSQGIGREVVNEFYGNAVVSVRAFVAALKVCRDRLFERKRESQFQGKESDEKPYRPAGR